MTKSIDDQQLLIQLRTPRGQEAAFRQLVQQYGPLLHRHLLRMLQSSADADDVLQNALVKVFRNLDRFRGESKLSTWLYRIATNEALTWLRSKQRRDARFGGEDPGGLAAASLTSDPYFDGNEAQLQLQQAMACLPDKQRAVFSFRYFDDLSYREISEITGTSEGGLKASYHLAVKKIQAKLKEHA